MHKEWEGFGTNCPEGVLQLRVLCVFTWAHEWPITQTQLWGHLIYCSPALPSLLISIISWSISSSQLTGEEKNRAEFTHGVSTESGLLWSSCPIQRWPQKKTGKRNLIKGKIYNTVSYWSLSLKARCPEIQIYIGSWAVVDGLAKWSGAWKEQEWNVVWEI